MITSMPRGFLYGFVKGGGSGGGSLSVTSVFTRTGDVVAATGDYSDLQITSSPTNVLTTTGDILYASAAKTLARLGIGTSGQVLTVVGGLPVWQTPGAGGGGGEIGYDQITAPVTVSSTTEATGTTIITCASHTFDGSPVIVQFFSPSVEAFGASNGFVAISLFESTTEQVGQIAFLQLNAATPLISSLSGWARFTPTAGAHTYLITAFKGGAGVTAMVNAGVGGTAAYAPAYCRFTKV